MEAFLLRSDLCKMVCSYNTCVKGAKQRMKGKKQKILRMISLLFQKLSTDSVVQAVPYFFSLTKARKIFLHTFSWDRKSS